ncbi:signal peptidase I [Ornithinimicrobium cerasi]|uniref:signal peptidase I n=1 Tax=Ornithinimicrobium cerasi TaxID=2248773 RepID=UPI001EFFC498|nr:signal peptidase I [Ornithinimicrobium cerasi]
MSDPSRDEVLQDGPQPEETTRRAQRARRHQEERKGGFWHAVRETLGIAVTALVISFIIKTFLAQAFWIPSGSMENTLVYGDRVMVSKIQAGPMEVERGDIAVFEDPGGWLPPSVQPDRGPVMDTLMAALQFVGVAPVSEGNHLIKRVIGVGGDTVACCDDEGRLSVNGEPLTEDYLYPGDEPSTVEFEVTVPEDGIWVMGDHRSNSRDSRAHDDGTGAGGSVPRDNVVGQAFVLLFPLENATWFRTPDTFAQVPQR